MTNHILDAAAAIRSEILRLEGLLSALENGSSAGRSVPAVYKAAVENPGTAKPVRGRKKRIRRSSADVQAQAEEMVAFIKGKGKAGAATAEIVAKFGKVLPSIKAFIAGKVDVKLKKIGAGRATVYYID